MKFTETVRFMLSIVLMISCGFSYAESEKIAECLQCHSESSHKAMAINDTSGCNNCHNDMPIEIKNTTNPLSADNRPVLVSSKGHLKNHLPTQYNLVGADLGEDEPMVLIPAGEFIMGSDSRLPDEGPSHKVTLKNYTIDIYEVTNKQYKKFIDLTARRSPAHFTNRTYPDGKADHPVTNVTWFDAQAYCESVGRRLPTDEEWEKAARGTDGRAYPWGNKFNVDYANTPVRWGKLKKEGDTMPVGSFPKGVSPYGLYDMSGNVWEWTSSWYTAYPGNVHPSENYGEQYKTLKGGSWWDCSFYRCGISAPSFNRSFFLRGTRNKSFGFRCASENSIKGQQKIAVLDGRHL
ncbi:MAG: formylglycine-generating enzyme family protein [Gammaproteobacteria bacterium]|nr:formylglycine-generating enzyme family protein [Gammaproteobacteria bacterium]